MAADSGFKDWARIAARLREDITQGRIGLGDQLGTETALAERYGTARGTVVQALRQLRDEGIIMTRHGQGSFVVVVPGTETVTLGPGDVITSRIPEPSERDALQMPPGVPLLVVRRRGSGEPQMYDASVTRIVGQG